MKVYSCKEMV